MRESTGLTIFGCVVAVCITIITISAQIYYQRTNSKIVEMVKSGADPVASSVALDHILDDKAKTYFLSKLTNQQGEE